MGAVATDDAAGASEATGDGFFSRFLTTVALGTPGVLTTVRLAYVQSGSIPDLPLPRSAVTPGTLLVLGCAVGAGRVGLRPTPRPE